MDYFEIFRSVEIIWLLWFASVLLTVMLLWYLSVQVSRIKPKLLLQRLNPARLHRSQDGAAYSISFILVFPFLVFLMAMIIETSFMLVAKLGTMHAAFAAARTGAVWSTGDTATRANSKGFTDLAHEKARQAAVTAMVPYASGMINDGAWDRDAKDAEKYYRIYESLKNDSAMPLPEYRSWNRADKPAWNGELSKEYIKKKYMYAAKHTTADLSLDGRDTDDKWRRYVVAEVSYVYPFKILPVGERLLGTRQPDGAITYKITSTARINNECPRNMNGTIGIKIY